MQPVSFSLKQRINFAKTVYRIFFHSSSALNNKDLIILTFITIAGLCQPVDERIVRKIDALVNEGVKDTR